MTDNEGMDHSANAAQTARLEERLAHVIENQRKVELALIEYRAEQKIILERLHVQMTGVQATLSESRGGMKVFAWLGFSSFGALLATAAAITAWWKGGH